MSDAPSATARRGEPRPLAALSRALRLGQHALFVLLLLVAWGRAAGEKPWFEAVAAALGLLYAAHALVEARVAPAPSPFERVPAAGGADAHHDSEWHTLTRALLGLLLLAWFASVTLTPDFAWLAFPLFFAVLRHLPSKVALPLIAVMVAAVVWSQALITGWNDIGLAPIVGPSVGALVSIGMAYAYRMLLQENAARQQLLDELTAAKSDLEATHEQLAETRREAGALEERARLSRDIHDTLAQGFSSIVLLSRAAATPGADVPALIGQMEAQAQASLGDAREVIGDLVPTELARAGFSAALARLVTGLGEHSDLRATFNEEGTGRPLPRPHEVALLRLTQGALANVTAHAAASRVAVSLSVDDDGTTLDIVDDGVGFDPATVGPREDGSGYGLRSMRERMAALGGVLTIESAPGQGSAIAAHLPAPGGTGE